MSEEILIEVPFGVSMGLLRPFGPGQPPRDDAASSPKSRRLARARRGRAAALEGNLRRSRGSKVGEYEVVMKIWIHKGVPLGVQ